MLYSMCCIWAWGTNQCHKPSVHRHRGLRLAQITWGRLPQSGAAVSYHQVHPCYLDTWLDFFSSFFTEFLFSLTEFLMLSQAKTPGIFLPLFVRWSFNDSNNQSWHCSCGVSHDSDLFCYHGENKRFFGFFLLWINLWGNHFPLLPLISVSHNLSSTLLCLPLFVCLCFNLCAYP